MIRNYAFIFCLIEQSGVFAVNILGADQVAWGMRFAGMKPEMKDRFAGIEARVAVTNSPILPNTLGWVDCELRYAYDGGDHTILSVKWSPEARVTKTIRCCIITEPGESWLVWKKPCGCNNEIELISVGFVFSVLARLADAFDFDLTTSARWRVGGKVFYWLGYSRTSIPGQKEKLSISILAFDC
ncbi:MAG: flavin reductase [Anaerolineales bacterium]|nr:flavin reductase [Anaerolineales bacterium]